MLYGTTQVQQHLARVQAIKNVLIKEHGTCFAHEYSSRFVWDEYLQAIHLPHPLISEFVIACILIHWSGAYYMYCL